MQRREQLPNTLPHEVNVTVRPQAPIQQQGQVYIHQALYKGMHSTEFVWLDGHMWDLEAFLMAQRSTGFRSQM
jgi:hypothetical protein